MDEKLAIVEKDNVALVKEEKELGDELVRLKEQSIALAKKLELAEKKLKALDRVGKVKGL